MLQEFKTQVTKFLPSSSPKKRRPLRTNNNFVSKGLQLLLIVDRRNTKCTSSFELRKTRSVEVDEVPVGVLFEVDGCIEAENGGWKKVVV